MCVSVRNLYHYVCVCVFVFLILLCSAAKSRTSLSLISCQKCRLFPSRGHKSNVVSVDVFFVSIRPGNLAPPTIPRCGDGQAPTDKLCNTRGPRHETLQQRHRATQPTHSQRSIRLAVIAPERILHASPRKSRALIALALTNTLARAMISTNNHHARTPTPKQTVICFDTLSLPFHLTT